MTVQEDPAQPVVIGSLGAVYGIKGWLRLNAFTDERTGVFEYQPWLLEQQGQWREVQVSQWRWHNKGLIVKLTDVDDREAAARLTGSHIGVPAAALPELAEDEYYWRDLIGLRVKNQQGYDMGIVDHLLPTVANDVLVVKANSNDAYGKRERLIPFVQSQYVLNIDQAAGELTVDWPADF